MIEGNQRKGCVISMSNNNEQQSVILETIEGVDNQETTENKEVKPKVTRHTRSRQQKATSTATVADFVTNPDAPIYAIKNLPEEYVATLFAWVSRSSKSFKEHLTEAIKQFNLLPPVGKTDDLADKAKAFHDKWTVGYGHSCYDEETQVLTKRGFIDWKDAKLEDEFASVNPKNNNIEYQKAVRLIREPYKGKMYKISHDIVDMLVTPNHKLYVSFDGDNFDLITAEEVGNKPCKVLAGLNTIAVSINDNNKASWVDYDGIVYCAELPKYHTLVVKRNGKTHVSGNSVAEHAKASLGLEKVSRLFTSEIELASQFLSITEYSQRYQKPERGDWYIIDHKNLKKPMDDAFNKLFDIFEKLIDLNLAEHIKSHKEKYRKEPTAKEKSAYEKLAFEDARYVLPLAMYSQLGISTNGRAWAEVLRNLGASTLKESVDVSVKAREELQKVLPSLLRHSSPSAYQLNKTSVLQDVKEEIAYYKSKTIDDILYRPTISSSMSYRDILVTLIKTTSMAAYTDNLKIENTSISRMSIEELEVMVLALVNGMGPHDMPPDSFKHIMFTIELSVSEANWHQLHRHNRKADFSFGLIHPENGVTIPAIAEQNEDIYALYEEADSISSELYDTINSVLILGGDSYKANYHAQYAALNMHHRNVYMTISLWSLHHLINLRTTDEAQWDIRNTFNKVYDSFVTRYPVFANSLKRR